MSESPDMWPNGRLRSDATLAQIDAEIEWQKAWRDQVRAIDDSNIRAKHANENLTVLRERRRKLAQRPQGEEDGVV